MGGRLPSGAAIQRDNKTTLREIPRVKVAQSLRNRRYIAAADGETRDRTTEERKSETRKRNVAGVDLCSAVGPGGEIRETVSQRDIDS